MKYITVLLAVLALSACANQEPQPKAVCYSPNFIDDNIEVEKVIFISPTEIMLCGTLKGKSS